MNRVEGLTVSKLHQNRKPLEYQIELLAVPPQASRFKRYFPIYFFLLYLALTLILFEFGPWRYPIDTISLVSLYSYLFAANLCLFLGYVRGIRKELRVPNALPKVEKLHVLSALVTLLLFVPTCFQRTGNLYPDIRSAIADPGSAYANSLYVREIGTAYVEYLRIFSGPLLSMVLPLTVFYWNYLRPPARWLGVVAVLSTVVLFVGTGTNKAVADTVLLVPCLFLAAQWAGTIRIRFSRVPIMILSSLSFVVFFLFFTSTMASRIGSSASTGYMPAIVDRADAGDTIGSIVPEELMPGYLGLSSYVTQGYYALSLALKEPFVPTWGVGNSMFLTKQAERVFGEGSISTNTYPFRIEKYGWDSIRLWSSIYPWLASDVSFGGVLVLMYFIGLLLAMAWSDTLTRTDPLAVVMFSILCIMIFYFPANNQVLQSGEGFTAFWITLLIWLKRRSRTLFVGRPR